MAETITGQGKDRLTLQLKLKAQSRMREEQERSGLGPEEWVQRERSNWRWSAGPSRGILQSAADLAGDFNVGIFGLLGPTVQDALTEIGIGRKSDEPPLMGIAGRGAQVAGESLALAAGGLGALGQKAVRTGIGVAGRELGGGGIRTGLSRDILQTADMMPKTLLAAEAAGGFGAGAGMEIGERAGSQTGASLLAIAGGIGGGAIPVVGLNFMRQAKNWALMNLAPWTESGGRMFAARRLQSLSADPSVAAERVQKGRPGISPARRTQDRNLLALEERVLENDPALVQQFADSLEGARRIAQTELRNEIGELRLPGEWERSVIERTAIPGTTITPGSATKMLDQAYKSFKPLYTEFAGYPVRPQLETAVGNLPLLQVFKQSINDPSVIAAQGERGAARAVLKNEFSRLGINAKDLDPTVDSGTLLTVRENLRDRIRELYATPDRAKHITANLLSNAETAVTMTLEQQLPAGAMQTMTQIDKQYRVYKVVEQAVFAAGDRPLSAGVLSQAVKQTTPPKQAEDLRRMVRSGREIESVIGKPNMARTLVRGQDETTRSAMQTEYLDTLWKRSLINTVGSDGTQLVSGKRLLATLTQNKETSKALGLTSEQHTRMVNIAREIQAMETKSPRALENLLEEGPHSIMQLLATIVGAKSGQHVAGKGIGSSLVLAGFFARRARKVLSSAFGDEAQKILIAAHKDPELYAALLTKPIDAVKKQDKAAHVLAAWLYPGAEFALDDVE